MPTAPRYSEPTVSPAGVPDVQIRPSADLETFGGGESARQLTNAASGFFDTTAKLALEEKRKADRLKVRDAARRATELETDIQYNPNTGVMNQGGRNAFNALDVAKKRWDDGLKEIEKDLHSDSQRQAFREESTARWLSLNSNVQRHMATEISKYDREVTDSLLAHEQNAASANYMDPIRIRQSLDRQEAAITNHGIDNGLPAYWITNKIAESRNRTHTSVIERMLANGQDKEAMAYYSENKADIVETKELTKAIDEGRLRGESQRESYRIMMKYDDWSDRYEAAGKIRDTDVRAEVEKRLKSNLADEKLFKSQAEEDISREAANIIESTRDFDQVPPTMLAKLPASARKSLRSYADDLREGKKPVTNWETYYELKTMATKSGDEFLKTNLIEYRSELSDAEFKDLVNLQAQVRKGDEKELDGYRTKSMIVNDTLNAAGIDPTPKPGAKDAERVAQFRRAVDAQLETFQRQTGKRAGNDDAQRIVDNLIVQGDVPGTGFFGLFKTRKRAYELEAGESLNVDVEDIPKEERRKIDAALKARNIEPTDDAARALYLKKLKSMNPGPP